MAVPREPIRVRHRLVEDATPDGAVIGAAIRGAQAREVLIQLKFVARRCALFSRVGTQLLKRIGMSKNGNVPVSAQEPRSPDVSRRQILQSVTVIAGGVAALLATGSPAEAKMNQVAAGYQDSPKNGQNCSSCALFKQPSSCTLVDGTISPNGWCRFYSKKS
jgi:hypothetical protein